MPKQIYNESDFSGGINGLDSPRDVAETQVIEGKSIAFDEKGRIRMLGRAVKTEIGNIVSDNITDPGFDAGTSFFRFGYDYGMLDDSDDDIFDTSPDAGETGFLVLGNRQHIAIWDSSSATGHWFTVAIDTGDDPTAGSRKMQFYFLNGALRAYNPTFFANSKPTWHGHVKRKLFGDANKDYSEWYTTTTKLMPPDGNTAFSNDFQGGNAKPGRSIILDEAGSATAVSGSTPGTTRIDMLQICLDDLGSSGTWIAGTYNFYLSYIYDGSQESPVGPAGGHTNGTAGMVIAADTTLSIGVIIDYNASLGTDFNGRITGARLYYSDPVDGDGTLYHLLDIDFAKGCRKFNETEYTDWNEDSTDVHECPTGLQGATLAATSNTFDFEDMPKTVTYEMLNGYGPTEETDIQFKCHTVLNNRLYVANIKQANGDTFPDRVVQTPINFTGVPQYDTFPIESGILDIAANDGDAVTALEGYGDRILVFKKKNVYVLNVANGGGYVETKFANMGVHSPHQVTATKYGIVWINSSGCYLYQEGQPINLLGDKLGTEGRLITPGMKWNVAEDKFPAIAYLPRIDKLLISIGLADGYSNDAWIYSFPKKSWSFGAGVIGSYIHERSNFVVDDHGDAYFAQNTGGTLDIYKWSDQAQSHNEFSILFRDFDAGQPNIRKKFYKAYIQFRCSDETNVVATYGVNGNYGNKLTFDDTQAGLKSSGNGELEASSTQDNLITTNADFMTESNATLENIPFSASTIDWNFGSDSYGWHVIQAATGGTAHISGGALIVNNNTNSDAVIFQEISVVNNSTYIMSFTNNSIGLALPDGGNATAATMMYVSTSNDAINTSATTHANLIDSGANDYTKAFVISYAGTQRVVFTADATATWYVCFRNVELTAGANPSLFASWVTSSLSRPKINASSASIKKQDNWTQAVLKPSTSSDANNVYSMNLRLDVQTAGTTNVPSDFEVDNISYVYRTKTVK